MALLEPFNLLRDDRSPPTGCCPADALPVGDGGPDPMSDTAALGSLSWTSFLDFSRDRSDLASWDLDRLWLLLRNNWSVEGVIFCQTYASMPRSAMFAQTRYRALHRVAPLERRRRRAEGRGNIVDELDERIGGMTVSTTSECAGGDYLLFGFSGCRHYVRPHRSLPGKHVPQRVEPLISMGS